MLSLGDGRCKYTSNTVLNYTVLVHKVTQDVDLTSGECFARIRFVSLDLRAVQYKCSYEYCMYCTE